MRKALVAAAVVVVLAAGGLVCVGQAGYLPGAGGNGATPSATPTAVKTGSTPPPPTPTPAGPVLAAPPPAVPPPAPAVLAARLDPLLRLPAVGPGTTALVADAATGGILYDRGAATAQTPASTAKLLTAAAALVSLPTDRGLQTRVVDGAAPAQIVLVGGGDPTLTASAQPASAYPRWASIGQLAARTATALRASGRAKVSILVDDSLFTGPAVSPSWPMTYLTSGVVAPVSALMIDEGRIRRGSSARSPDPALAAGRRFAALLRDRGLSVAAVVVRGRAAVGAPVLASVESPPVPVLVEHMLRISDNDLAESLARLAARSAGAPASFAGYSAALPGILTGLGVASAGVRLVDGSGLARNDLLSAAALGSLLSRAAAGGDPRLRTVLTGLPVGGFSGSLAGRFTRAPTAAAAGEVRAKTGTLTGVISLAGTVYDASGRLLVFAVLADRVPGGAALRARATLDRFASTLAACGCD